MNNDKATSITKYVSSAACAVTPQHWPRCKRLKCLLAAAMTIAAGPVFADWTVTTQELIPIATSPLLDRFGEDVNYQFDAAYAKTVTAETIPSGSIGINNYVSSKTVSYSSSRDATWVEYQLSGMQSGTLNSQYNFSGTRPSITCRPRISATVGENTTSFERSCTVTVTMTTTVRYSPSLNTTSSTYSWYFIIKQAAGSATVTVTLDSNEGTEAQPYPSYLYVNGGKNFSFSNGPTYTFINTGYKQTTMQAPSGAVTTDKWQQYANSFVMPTTTRAGCVFDGWWTVSTFPEANNIRISDANNTPIEGVRPTAKVTTIKAHWFYEAPHNFTATRNHTDMIALSWEPIADVSETTYKIYRSQNETCPTTPTFTTATTSYNDTDAVAGQEYNYWIVAERPNTYSVTHSLTNTTSGYREMPQVAMPSIAPVNGSTFTTSSTTVSLGSETDDVMIRYTTNGSEPDEYSTEYLAPFAIYNTTTIKAKAFKDGMRPSETVTATIVRLIPVALGTALDTDLTLTTGGSGEWTGLNDATAAVGGDCIKSGQIGNRASTWISTTVSGKGTFSFWWKVSCEAGEEYDSDYSEFSAPDADVSVICRDGIMAAWEQITVVFSTDGEHELKWTYKKDKSGADGEDCLYLDGFSWTPALPVPISLAITGATSVMAGGTATYTCTVTRNDGTSGLVTPTWSITSGGTYASINSSGVLNANGIAIPQSVTIQASYTQNGTTKTATKTITINTKTVTITFNPNGGTVSPTTRSYTAYSTYGSLPSATYTGNSFAGWFTTVNGGIQITESSTVPASATTLYAHWTENPPPTPTYTESTPVPVRHDWLAKYAGILASAGNDYEAAAMRSTGKRDGKGNALCVWHDYVAGTDPTNANSRFTAKVEFDNGIPKVGWAPDLNENGTKSERFYKIFGKKTLAANENWTRIADEADQKDYNFFKVTVNMEETPDTEEELKFGDGSGTGGGTDGGGINVDDNGDERPITLESPYNFSAAGTGYGYIQLRWRSDMSYSSDSSKWVDFCVYRANVNDITMATKVATMSMRATYIPKEYEDRVDGFDTYYYWIRTETGTARSEWSAVASAALYLSGPKNLTATCDRYEGVMLEWDAQSEATSYKVYADDEGGWSYNFTREVGETTGTSILDDDAPIGTKVRYKVLVVSPYAYEYSYSTVLGARYSGEQTAPDIAGSGNTEGIGISWQPVIGAVAYDIYRNTRNESSSATKIGTLASSGLNNGNSIGYTDKTVDIGTTYYYWVKAVYASNESGFSQVFSAAKFAPHPTNVKATSLRSDGILLTWEPAVGATSYRIYSGSVMLTETTACRWLDTSIAQGSSRTYTKVTSVCAAGEYEIGGYVYLTGYRTSSDTIASVTMTGTSELELSSNNKITLLCMATMSSGEELSINPDSWDFSELPEGAYQYEKPNEYLYLTIDRNCFIGAGAKTVTIWATWTANERDCDPTVYNLSHTVVIHPSE